MRISRTATSTIWRTVVFAGAMLGAPACTHKTDAPATTPASNTGGGDPAADDGDPGTADPCADDGTTSDEYDPDYDPDDDPCSGRIRGADEGEGGMGRGFVLS